MSAALPRSPADRRPAAHGPALDVRLLRRRVDAARLAVATATFAAALWAWDGAVPADTRIATLAFAGAVAWTAVAFVARGWRGRALDAALAVQIAIDLWLATASVHVTGGGASQFAALYVLAITEAALLLPTGGAILAAVGACALYSAEVVWWRPVHVGGTAPPAASKAERADLYDDVRTLAGLTVHESDRLSRLLGEFLDFSRTRVTHLAPVDLAAAARAAVRIVVRAPTGPSCPRVSPLPTARSRCACTAIVQRAVEAHGGVVLVDGGVGEGPLARGATFTLTLILPRAAGSAAVRVPPVRPYLPTPAAPLRAVA